MKFYINGRFLTQRITGVQRYALEMTKAIDDVISYDTKLQENEYIILTPKNILCQPKLKNIQIVTKGVFSGHIWEQNRTMIFP